MELIQHPLTPEGQILIKEETRQSRNAILTYRLWSVGYGRKTRYHVSITENGNTAEQVFETDGEGAVAIFRNAVSAAMTPRRLLAHKDTLCKEDGFTPCFHPEESRNPQEYQKSPLHFQANML